MAQPMANIRTRLGKPVGRNCKVYLGPLNGVRVMVSEMRPMSPREHTMPADKLPGSPHDSAPKAARERRESQRLITDWEQETTQLGRALALMTLDVSAMPSEKWAHRFIISLRPVVEDCVLLFYGAKFAALMELPAKPDHSVPMVEQLPARYVPVFTKGCIDAALRSVPVRLQGAADREDGRQELYRVAFIAFTAEPLRQRRLAFGAFNCRVAEGQA
jgi:hypothetical protein